MADPAFVITRQQRDDIMKAVTAIERQLREIAGRPMWQVQWVVGMNLTTIHANLTHLPRAHSN